MIILAKNYPKPTVEIMCGHCERYGRMTLEKFCQMVGPETPLPDALTVFVRARGCSLDRPSPDNLDAPCRPQYANLRSNEPT
jgi:hypothetical protein